MASISSYMEQDHVLIDGIARRAVAAAAAADWAGLEREAREFLSRLRRHIEMEEEVLFTAFEQRTGMATSGPSVQMRHEHELMRPILERMERAAAGHDAVEFQQATRALTDILEPHNQKEEQMMYPMLDQAMGPDAQALLAEVVAMAV